MLSYKGPIYHHCTDAGGLKLTYLFQVVNGSFHFPNAPMTMHFRDPRLRNMSRTPLSPIPLARTDSFKFSYFPDATLLWNRLPTDVFAPPSLTLKLIFGLTFNCTFVLLCAVVVVVLFICLFVSCFGCVGTPLILALLSTGRSFALQCKIDIEKRFCQLSCIASCRQLPSFLCKYNTKSSGMCSETCNSSFLGFI